LGGDSSHADRNGRNGEYGPKHILFSLFGGPVPGLSDNPGRRLLFLETGASRERGTDHVPVNKE
jgi:hypothetical protein